jgi:hypothetical protein
MGGGLLSRFWDEKRTNPDIVYFSKGCCLLPNENKKGTNWAGITDCPAFIDDQGVMYHGSEFFAACRG